jgi:hypothetical protein
VVEAVWEDGVVSTDYGEVIARPGMAFNLARSTTAGSRGRAKEVSKLRRKLEMGPVLIKGDEWFLDADFDSDMLGLVVLVLSREGARSLFGNGDVRDRELQFYRETIEALTGKKPPGKYSWGLVDALQDHWTLDPAISFNYRRRAV